MAQDDGESAGQFGVYKDYSDKLRNWLVTFGATLPGFCLGYSDKIYKALQNAHEASNVFQLCLYGVSAQLLLVFINKYITWLNYYFANDTEGEGPESEDPPVVHSNLYKKTKHFAEWAGAQIWIDAIIDVITVALYIAAVVKIANAITGAGF